MAASLDHFRAHARPGQRVRVRYRPIDDPCAPTIETVTTNIGAGGAFLLAEHPPLPSTVVEIDLQSSATWDPIRMRAVVRFVTDGPEPGFGVEFSELTPSQIMGLHDFLATLGGSNER